MTITLPLPTSHAGPSRQTRSFGDIEQPYNVPASLIEVVQAVRASKRIVVVCGAGVSTAAGIPDFRSAQGLFTNNTKPKTRSTRSGGSAKQRTALPLVRGKRPDVKDLFHVKSLSDEHLLPAHNHLLNSLFEITQEASPTPFHSYLSKLDSSGKLLRCYTQNIDGLEEKAGMIMGLPERSICTPVKRRRKNTFPPTPDSQSSSHIPDQPYNPPTNDGTTSRQSVGLPETPESVRLSSPDNQNQPFPRVIPLHGTLSVLNCTVCSTSFPFADYHPLPTLHLSCPHCFHLSLARSASFERQRPQGLLRPGIVLYGEEHPKGHLIGKVVERDLKGLGSKSEREGKVDCLIVTGTSLSIPGIKRIIKEMARVLREKGGLRVIYINDDSPSNPKEWLDVFHVWIKGDIQHFVTDYLDNPTFGTVTLPIPPKARPIKTAKTERTRSRPQSAILKHSGKVILPTPPKTPRTEMGPQEDPGLTPTSEVITYGDKRKRSIGDSSDFDAPPHSPVRRIKIVSAKNGKLVNNNPVIPEHYWSRDRSPSLTPCPEGPEAYDVFGDRISII